MSKFFKILFVLLIPLLLLTGCCGDVEELSESEAKETLKSYMKKIKYTESQDLVKDISGSSDVVLASINKYPLSVECKADVKIEIFSSTEKSSSGKDGWLNEVAKKFNSSNHTVNGKSACVEIRPIASGLAMDYLTSRTYVPDAFTSSNELWAEMLKARGLDVTMIDSRLAGNTAGILIKSSLYDSLKKEHGELTLQTILDLGIERSITLGYTSPYSSSTGLNLLVSMLTQFDSSNPLSENAINQMIKLQASVPPALLTTIQMRDSAASGLIDIMVMEYQAYINNDSLKDYVFIPIGVRHDSPMYAMKSLSGDKMQLLKDFTSYAKNSESQKLATDYGFNAHNDYKGASINLTGDQLYKAQAVWKENKDGGTPIIAVFVADLSGSMDGAPITSLKNALVNASSYIGVGNYVGLVSYSNSVTINLPIGLYDSNQKSYFNGAVKKFKAGGSTYTHEALLVAANMIQEAKEKYPEAKPMIFLLTDGEANGWYGYSDSAKILKGLQIPVHCIGFNGGSSELTDLSSLVEASYIQADNEDVAYQLRMMFQSGL